MTWFATIVASFFTSLLKHLLSYSSHRKHALLGLDVQLPVQYFSRAMVIHAHEIAVVRPDCECYTA